MAERFVLTIDKHTKELIERQAKQYTEGNTSAYIRGTVVLHALMENAPIRGVDIPGWITMLYDFDMLKELSDFLTKQHANRPEMKKASEPRGHDAKKKRD